MDTQIFIFLQVVVFNISTPGNIMKAIMGDADVGTLVSGKVEEADCQWSSDWQARLDTANLVQR